MCRIWSVVRGTGIFLGIAAATAPCTLGIVDAKMYSRETTKLTNLLNEKGLGDVVELCKRDVSSLNGCLRNAVTLLKDGITPGTILRSAKAQMPPENLAPLPLPSESYNFRPSSYSNTPAAMPRRPQDLPGSIRSFTRPFSLRDPAGLGRRY